MFSFYHVLSPKAILKLPKSNNRKATEKTPGKPYGSGASYAWTHGILRYQIYIVICSQWLLDNCSNTSWSNSTFTFTFMSFLKSHYFL